MKISEFAKVTGISRKNLIFYDKIGLLSPAMVDEQNNYRYYTYQQIDTVNVITVLREIGMPLKEIKAYLQERSPSH
jgi:DNA-binding transcriptional MerR regulator